MDGLVAGAQGPLLKTLEVFIAGAITIGGILTVCGLAFYVLWWITLVAIRRIPMIGRRYKHRDWDRLNRY